MLQLVFKYKSPVRFKAAVNDGSAPRDEFKSLYNILLLAPIHFPMTQNQNQLVSKQNGTFPC